MLGTFKKDLLVLKKDILIFIPIVILLSTFKTFTGYFIISVYSIGILFNLLTYEARGKSNEYFCIFPNGRKNMVISKYILFIILTISLTILNTSTQIIVDYVKGEEIILGFNNFIYICLPTISISLVLPIVFIFDVEKAGILLFFIAFGIPFSMVYVPKVFPNLYEYFLMFKNMEILIFIFTVILYILSFFISLWVNSRKDY